MPTIDELKEQEATPTPLFLIDCTLANGDVERWGTHAVTFEGHAYAARLVRHNLFEIRSSPEEGLDGAAKISLSLANADSHFSQIERGTGFKGARAAIRLVFFDLVAGAAESEARVVFQGIASTPDEITEDTLRVTFASRFNLQRIVLPEVRIQRRCPWMFPSTEAQRQEALTGGAKGKYSALYRCGYSAGLDGGVGTLDGSSPFTSCDYTRASCEARGMFGLGRFGGVEFVPPQITVRSHGESGSHLSALVENEARYNDFVPLVYGTAWCEPPVVFARNDGNLTHVEVLLGMGEIEAVAKVIVNDVEIPEAVEGADMTATGWYNVVTLGTRSGSQNPDFADAGGTALGDPYGSMAMAAVVVPNGISNGQSSPRVKVLLGGLKVERFDAGGGSIGEAFTANPAWVLLDVLRRSGWLVSEIDLPSFAHAATYCEEPVDTTDLHGNPGTTDRYQCNLVVSGRRSAAELVRGIRLGSALMLTYGVAGLLTLRVENTLAVQQPEKPDGSNGVADLDGGWPAYEFSDGSDDFSGILRRGDGSPTLRLFARSGGETANRLVVEFQDEFNEYQQDSLSLVDVDDALLTGREVTATFAAQGLPNFDQATRVLDLQLSKLIRGNTFVEFETTVRGIGLAPGDLITVTYLKEGLARQLFRVVRIAPGVNYQTVQITAQWHDDDWYTQGGADAIGGRRRAGADVGLPRPLVGAELDSHGVPRFSVSDQVVALPNADVYVRVKAAFHAPALPAPAGSHIPLVDLTPSIATTGGTLAGGRTYYYAVSAKDGEGSESGLSFAVRAKVPSGTNTNAVMIGGLSFSGDTTAFHVYRGPSPGQLLRIAADQAVAATFADSGLTAELQGPPDENFHHANFYWRSELVPENNVESHSLTTVGNSTLGLGVDDFVGATVRITRGTGAPQERTVVSNTATAFTITPPWRVEPDSTSYLTVAESTWKLGGAVAGSPVEFEGPPQPGSTIQVSGRAANVHNRESAYELSPVTRWQIGSGGGSGYRASAGTCVRIDADG
ncbi:MAG: phage tail protein [Acidobacteriota bacterium]